MTEEPEEPVGSAGEEVEAPSAEPPRADLVPADSETVEAEIVDEITRVARVAALTVVRQISGPLPSADEMKGYKEVDPALPMRIVDGADEERRHRHSMERRKINFSSGLAVAGVVVGAVWMLGALYISWYALRHHESVVGIAGIVAAGVPFFLRLVYGVVGGSDDDDADDDDE